MMKANLPILLVEDDYVDVLTVRKALKQLDITNPLVIQSNGEEALAWLRDHLDALPAIILLDLNMPRMNGLEFLQAIKSDARLRLVPVVVLTTSEDEQDRIESFRHSVAGYMLKSLSYPDFLQTMASIRDYWTNSQLPY
ncbi:MAG: response regulator [Bacteroidetes bacterium]|nr:MAG: response regulator [Bacteroidota bacterium]